MKSLAKTAMLFVTLFSYSALRAQISTNAPRLFDAFPNTINCNNSELGKIFSLSTGNEIEVSLENNFIFKGVITYSIQKFPKLKTVLIKSSNFNNALFAISKRVNDDNSITYVGHILNDAYADGFELRKTAQGNYSLNKIKNEDILQDR